jgi:flavin reductase (DIM6/NTAB) family NADH-FMN oxidoreductase RutF
MDEQTLAAKKTTLRMIPYGFYVLGHKNGEELGAATVNWVTQCSFEPPLVAVGIKKDSGAYASVKATGTFALSFLESGQKDLAFAFFKGTEVEGDKLNGYQFETAQTGAPILSDAPAWVELRFVSEVDTGDHSCVVAEVVNAGLKRESDALTLKEVGVNYGG